MSNRESSREISIGRREALRVLGRGAGCVASVTLLTTVGCGTATSRTTFPLADLPIGQRVRVLDGENPVELLRTNDGVRARSLWCTHSGCEVRWVPERQEYFCPCHDGVFDADGQILAGPPPRPLASYPVQVTETEILLGVGEDGGAA